MLTPKALDIKRTIETAVIQMCTSYTTLANLDNQLNEFCGNMYRYKQVDTISFYVNSKTITTVASVDNHNVSVDVLLVPYPHIAKDASKLMQLQHDLVTHYTGNASLSQSYSSRSSDYDRYEYAKQVIKI